jgi:Rrf2 family nitric oxide-sensitive transcriptional repressor
MQFTRFTDYSLRVLIYLGQHPGNWVTIREISDAYDISRNHLMKVVSFLGNRGYLTSQRGPGGGVRLNQDPERIRLADVILDAEGDMNLLECMRLPADQLPTAQRRLCDLLQGAVQAFVDTLNGQSLADLLENKSAPLPRLQASR